MFFNVSYDPVARQIFEVLSRSGMRVSNDNHLPAPIVDMVLAYWRTGDHTRKFKCVSSVAGVGLQDLANRANQISVSN